MIASVHGLHASIWTQKIIKLVKLCLISRCDLHYLKAKSWGTACLVSHPPINTDTLSEFGIFVRLSSPTACNQSILVSFAMIMQEIPGDHSGLSPTAISIRLLDQHDACSMFLVGHPRSN